MSAFLPFDVDTIMRGMIRKNPAPLGKERLRFALALEIRDIARDSRLLVDLDLRGNGHPTHVDVLGLIGEQKLAIQVHCGAFDTEGYSRDLEQMQRLCALDPDLVGLVLVVANGCRQERNQGHQVLTWRGLPVDARSPWAEFEYAFTWIGASPPTT